MARIALIGPGAIGGTTAAALLQAGRHELTICANQAFETLTVSRAEGETAWSGPVRVATSSREVGPADWVVLAVKSHQTEGAADWLKATVGPKSRLAVLQNGVEHRERVKPFVPAGTPVVPVVVQLPAQRMAPGRIALYGLTQLAMPDDEVSREFAGLFGEGFMKVKCAGDFMSVQWEKLCMNAPGGAISALTNRADAIGVVPGMDALARTIIEECMAVGRAEGAVFKDDLADRLLAFFGRPANRGNSMYYDRRDGRKLEWDARNAVIVRMGEKHGIPTPVSAALVPLLRALDPA